MAALKDFKKDWKNLTTLSEVVQILDKTKGDPIAFASNHSGFLNFVEDIYRVHGPQIEILRIGHPRQKVDSAENFLYLTQKDNIKTARRNIRDISKDLGDDLEVLALSVVPIKTIDLNNADKLNLNKIIRNYGRRAVKLRDELQTIDRNTEQERYEVVEDLAKENEGFASVIKDYKPLVKNIAKYRGLISHLSSNRGRPDTAKLKEIFVAYLDKLSGNTHLNKHDKMVLEIAKTFSNNENYLGNYYMEGILKPAEKKVKETVRAGNYDIEKYLNRTVESMNMNNAGVFFNELYAKKAA